MATADFTVIGLGRPEASASPYLAEIRRRLEAQDRVGFRMHAMGTSLEGSVDDILAVVREMHAVPLEMGLPRAYTVLKLDERTDKPDQTLADKEWSVEERRPSGESGAPVGSTGDDHAPSLAGTTC
jgi:uncharacterized protein (TIGR00106 family)